MGEELQGGVCGGMWWNPQRNMFSGGGAGALSSPCSVAQLVGGYDMSNFGWPKEAIKSKLNDVINHFENGLVCDNSMVFPSDMDSSFDNFGFGPSPTSSTTDFWNLPNLLCKDGGNEGSLCSITQDDVNSGIYYPTKKISSTIINPSNFSNNNNNWSEDGSPPMALTPSSNSSGDSSSVTCEGSLNTSFPISSSASFLIQSLFDDIDDSQLLHPNYEAMSLNDMISPCSWDKTSNTTPIDQGPNNIQPSLLSSLETTSQACNNLKHTSNGDHANSLATKVNKKEVCDLRSNLSEQPPTKRMRIETPSSLPTFKVRKEKLGDRITALQQLVSPFGKTDTASVLHEAIEYIKFLHDQVNALSTPYLKNGAATQHQQDSNIMKDKEQPQQELRSRGLCLVPISSTYPVAQETPVDFWTPTFGGTTF